MRRPAEYRPTRLDIAIVASGAAVFTAGSISEVIAGAFAEAFDADSEVDFHAAVSAIVVLAAAFADAASGAGFVAADGS